MLGRHTESDGKVDETEDELIAEPEEGIGQGEVLRPNASLGRCCLLFDAAPESA